MIESAQEATFVRLFETYHRAVLAYFLRRLPRDDAYDAAADVFVVAWRRRSDVPEGDEASTETAALPGRCFLAWID